MNTITVDIGTALLFENDHVRVWEMTLEPGETSHLHRHAYDYVLAYVTPDNDLQVEWNVDREPQRLHCDDGFVQYTKLGNGDELPPHRLHNVGTTQHRQILVEFLAPTGSEALEVETNGRGG